MLFWKLNLYCILVVLCTNCNYGPLHYRSLLTDFSKFKSPKISSSCSLSLKKGKFPLIIALGHTGAWPRAGLGPHPTIGGGVSLRTPVSVGC